MKLKDCRDTYYEFSGKLSDNARNLAFAGIAIVWIFKQENISVIMLPFWLKLAMAMFVLSLFFDLSQYIFQTVVWGWFHDYKERQLQNNEDTDFLAPLRFKQIAGYIFWLKVIVLFVGYIFVLLFFVLGNAR